MGQIRFKSQLSTGWRSSGITGLAAPESTPPVSPPSAMLAIFRRTFEKISMVHRHFGRLELDVWRQPTDNSLYKPWGQPQAKAH